jgi:2-polyprenyl-6-methoxyphenol hydroxylase-like FAD-dependent oxidoreductase
MDSYDVVVIGGGPVGAALAVDLGQRGIRTAIVERRPEIAADHPRARGFNLRTAQHLKRWGLLERFRELSMLPGERFADDVAYVTSMSGYEITRQRSAFYGVRDPGALYGEPGIQAQQFQFEQVCWDEIERLDSVVGYRGVQLGSIDQDVDGATVVVHGDDGHETVLHTAYVVGCDGARSAVRKQIGVELQGKPAIGANNQIVFRAPDMWKVCDKAFAVMYWIIQPTGTGGFCLPVNGIDTWVYSIQRMDEEGVLLPAEATELIRRGIGADIEIEIISIEPYASHAMLANRYRNGRVFLAGDAAHLHPTYGGHGLNTGVSDAADLGWKLATVIKGWGADGLLDSYEAERRPVAAEVIRQSSEAYSLPPGRLWREGLDDAGPAAEAIRAEVAEQILLTKRTQFWTMGTQIGYGYPDSPCVESDGSTFPPMAPDVYTRTASPGGIAPHVQLSSGRSIHDSFGPWMTLLKLLGAPSDDGGIEEEAQRRGIPLHVVTVDEGIARRVYESSLVLIRPDQHVAWRAVEPPADPKMLWSRVMGEL